MKKFVSFSIALGIFVSTTLPAQARDTTYMLSIEEGMNTKDAQAKLDGSVKFYFAGQPTPTVLKTFNSDVSNRKTNSFGKSDQSACNWAFLSALLAFQERAKELGANAVVNMVRYYKKDEKTSPTQFECHAGAIIAGVALKGDLVTIGDQ